MAFVCTARLLEKCGSAGNKAGRRVKVDQQSEPAASQRARGEGHEDPLYTGEDADQ